VAEELTALPFAKPRRLRGRRKPPRPKAPARPRQSAMTRATRAFNAWIVRRDNFTCFTCGFRDPTPGVMQAGHFVPKSLAEALRFDERNVHCQCDDCNVWSRGARGKYAEALGPELVAELEAFIHVPHKWTPDELTKIAERYERR